MHTSDGRKSSSNGDGNSIASSRVFPFSMASEDLLFSGGGAIVPDCAVAASDAADDGERHRERKDGRKDELTPEGKEKLQKSADFHICAAQQWRRASHFRGLTLRRTCGQHNAWHDMYM